VDDFNLKRIAPDLADAGIRNKEREQHSNYEVGSMQYADLLRSEFGFLLRQLK
jgi:hypothetical protein